VIILCSSLTFSFHVDLIFGCQPKKFFKLMTTKIASAASLLIYAVAIISCRYDAITQPQSNLLFPKVKTIIQTNCLGCHSPGGEGMPVVLTTDDDIVQLAESIKHATVDPVSPRNRRMPPTGDLSEEDKNTIAEWFEGGGTAAN
jgi:uncharacterized membrane protein